ncbi:unnamed protein product [Ectocarpus sp. 4 AP-2014]
MGRTQKHGGRTCQQPMAVQGHDVIRLDTNTPRTTTGLLDNILSGKAGLIVTVENSKGRVSPLNAVSRITREFGAHVANISSRISKAMRANGSSRRGTWTRHQNMLHKKTK